nr:hypothetical protein [Tanacetum cinerariifolium]
MKEYIRLEEEKAHRRGNVYNWKTATYGKIWDNKDVHDFGSVEIEFPAIVFNDTLMSKPTGSSLNNEIDFRILFDDSDDEDYTPIRRIQDFDELKDHWLTLKNTLYPHQRYAIYNTLVNKEEPTNFTSIRRIQQEDTAYPCLHFSRNYEDIKTNTMYLAYKTGDLPLLPYSASNETHQKARILTLALRITMKLFDPSGAKRHGPSQSVLLGLKDFLVLLKLLLLVMVFTAAKVNAASEYGYKCKLLLIEDKLQLGD